MRRLKNNTSFSKRMKRFCQKKLPYLIEKKKSVLMRTLRKQGVLQAGIFGSYATGKYTKNSDVDILVKVKKNLSLFDFAGIKVAAEEILGKKVDLVEYDHIKPRLRERILGEEVKLL